MALDKQGRIFFDSGPAREGTIVRVEPDGRLASLKTLTPRGPYEPANSGLRLPSVGRLAPDGSGGVLVAAGAKVVSLDARGALRNVAGDPAHPPLPAGSGKSGDGGPADSARFGSARSVAADEAGNLYVADQVTPKEVAIRFINRSAVPVEFFQGSASAITIQPRGIDTLAPVDASLAGRDPVVAFAAGRLYLATSDPARVRLINTGPQAVGAHGLFVESGRPAELRVPLLRKDSRVTGLAAAPSGDLYVSDVGSHRVIRIAQGGAQEVFAGAPSGRPRPGFNGNERAARGALLNRPFSLAAGADGRVYISDQANRQVRVVDASGVIRAAPGAGALLRWKCPGKRSSAASTLQGAPAGVAVQGSSTYFTTSLGHQVKKSERFGEVVTVAGGRLPADCSRHRRKATAAAFKNPTAIAAVASGVYVADCSNTRISVINTGARARRFNGIAVSPGAVVTVAGTGTAGFAGDGSPATKAAIGGSSASPVNQPVRPALEEGEVVPPDVSFGALAADGKGSLFIADIGNGRVRRVDPAGTITTIAGEGVRGSLGECCRRPAALAADAKGNLYVFDSASLRVWYANLGRASLTLRGVQVPSGEARSVAGNGKVGFEGEGGAAVEAQLLFPTGIAVDSKNLYVLEVGAALGPTAFDQVIRGVAVRKVDPSGRISTVVGPGHVGFNGDYLSPNLTSLSHPTGIAVDACGDVLVADLGSDRVRRISFSANCPE